MTMRLRALKAFIRWMKIEQGHRRRKGHLNGCRKMRLCSQVYIPELVETSRLTARSSVICREHECYQRLVTGVPALNVAAIVWVPTRLLRGLRLCSDQSGKSDCVTCDDKKAVHEFGPKQAGRAVPQVRAFSKTIRSYQVRMRAALRIARPQLALARLCCSTISSASRCPFLLPSQPCDPRQKRRTTKIAHYFRHANA